MQKWEETSIAAHTGSLTATSGKHLVVPGPGTQAHTTAALEGLQIQWIENAG